MNTKTGLLEKTDNPRSKFATACLKSCIKLMEQIARVKQIVLDEFRDTVDVHHNLLRLAANEAEALAYETDYPHLVFPALATEKAQEIANWETRQRAISMPPWTPVSGRNGARAFRGSRFPLG
jgi:hypothetical protein